MPMVQSASSSIDVGAIGSTSVVLVVVEVFKFENFFTQFTPDGDIRVVIIIVVVIVIIMVIICVFPWYKPG